MSAADPRPTSERPPARRGAGWATAAWSLAAFAASLRLFVDGPTAAALVAVVVLHEAGHLLAMRLFGYTRLRLFFVPLVGAAVHGVAGAAKPWQSAAVILLGPAPGLVLAVILHWSWPAAPPAVQLFVDLSLLLNGLNLVPLLPLDGGQLVREVLAARPAWRRAHRTASAVLLSAAAGLAALYLFQQGQRAAAVLTAVIAGAVLLGIRGREGPPRQRHLTVAQAGAAVGLQVMLLVVGVAVGVERHRARVAQAEAAAEQPPGPGFWEEGEPPWWDGPPPAAPS